MAQALLKPRIAVGTVVAAIGLLFVPATAGAANFTVTKTADTNDDVCNADCSLREAIEAANDNGPALDTITLPAGNYALTLPGTGEDLNQNGDLDVLGALTINGAGAATTVIGPGTGVERILDVGDIVVATLNGVTVTGGRAGDGGIGGGIQSDASLLNVNDSVISGNTASSAGGAGIGVQDSGGLAGGGLSLQRSTVSGNTAATAGVDGSGIYVFNGNLPVTISRSTISGNTADEGAGMFVQLDAGDLNVVNSTIAGNTATGSAPGAGGGIHVAPGVGGGVATFALSTIAGNAAPGSGVANLATTGGSGEVAVASSIIADPIGAPNCSGGMGALFDSLGTNVASDASCNLEEASDLIADPLLGPPASNGGMTLTRLLLPGSPAIDRAASCLGETIDQRGRARPEGAACDAGAVERKLGAPETTIGKRPKRKLRSKRKKVKVRISFSSDDPGASFQCMLDKGEFAPCASPLSFKVKRGRHRVLVRAIDAEGNVDPTPAAIRFKVLRKKKGARRS